MHIYVCVYIRKSFICLPLYLCSPVVPQCKQLKRTSKQTLQKALHTCHVIRACTAFGSVCFYCQKSPKNKHSNTPYIPATSAILSSTSSMRPITLFKSSKKSLHTPQKAQHTLQRALHIFQRSLRTLRRALHMPQRALRTRKRALHMPQRALRTRKRGLHTHTLQKALQSDELHTLKRAQKTHTPKNSTRRPL